MSRVRNARANYAVLAVAIVLLAAACAGKGTSRSTASTSTTARPAPTSSHATGPSAGCNAKSPKPGVTDNTITSGGKARTYQLDIPEGYDGTRPYGLVFALHSLTVDYRIVMGMSGFDDMQKKYRFIGVSPSGLVNPVPYWNAAPVKKNYDVAYLTDLLNRLEKRFCIDTAKVFSIGMSNGAQMSSLLGCRLPDRIAGIAPIAGVEFNRPCSGAPVPIIAFHGVMDPIVPYKGGGLNSVAIADQNFYKGAVPAGTAKPTGVDESKKNWAKHNGCDPKYVEKRISPEVRKRTWQHCQAATEIYLVDNGGHAWPGKPQPAFEKSFGHGTTDIDATNLSWAFFFNHKQ
jgi:polyhydroxybutyrate depolymerase